MRSARARLALILAVIGIGLAWLLLRMPSKPAPAAAREQTSVPRTASSGERPREATPPETATELRLATTVPQGGHIIGRVTTADGEPAVGAGLMAEGRVGSRAITDDSGHFAIDVAAGTWSVVAMRDGLASAKREGLVVAPGATVEVELVLEQGASLVVTVRDAADGRSLSACLVRLGALAREAACDHGGRVRLEALAPGAVPLEITAPGYAPRALTVSISRRVRSTVDVTLARGASLAGIVYDPNQRPVAGARVRTQHYALEGSPIVEVSGSTSKDGRFVLEGVAPGRVTVVAEAAGWPEAASTEQRVGADSKIENLAIVLTTGGALSGSVVQAGGGPVPGATVEVLRLADRAAAGRDVTAEDGSFRFDGLRPGDYTVSATAGALRGLATSVSVSAREEAQVSLVLGRDGITGRVIDAAGKPVGGALVTGYSQLSSGLGGSSTSTDREGKFQLSGLAGPPFRVQAEATHLGATEVRGVAAGGSVELVLAGAGRVEGSVTDGTGAVEELRLSLSPTNDHVGGTFGRARSAALLSPDGSFAFDEVPAGRYRVQAEASGRVDASEEVEVRAGATSRIDLRLDRGITISGRVVRDGAPVAGCTVLDRVTTGADGAFKLTGMRRVTRMFLWASCPATLDGGTWVDLPAGDRAGVELPVRPRDREDATQDFGGVGMGLRVDREGRVFVTFVSSGGPASQAGVRPGDEVVAVDGWQTLGAKLEAVVARIRGPVGQPVALDLKRASTGAAFRAYPERARIPVN